MPGYYMTREEYLSQYAPGQPRQQAEARLNRAIAAWKIRIRKEWRWFAAKQRMASAWHFFLWLFPCSERAVWRRAHRIKRGHQALVARLR